MRLPERLIHPVGLPTLLPPGHVRCRLMAARREMGCLLFNPADHNLTPEHFSSRPFTTPERYLVLGMVAWDEIHDELTFNIVDGCLGKTTEGRPMILKLSDKLFFNVTSSTVVEFEDKAQSARLYQNGKIEGPPAGRLYRMLDELVVRDRKRWRRMFPPDPEVQDRNNKMLCKECQGSGTIGPSDAECLYCEGSGMLVEGE